MMYFITKYLKMELVWIYLYIIWILLISKIFILFDKKNLYIKEQGSESKRLKILRLLRENE